jgi:hypothetical protein
LRIAQDGQVYLLSIKLRRFQCAACGTTFRNYPAGVAAHKRYHTDPIFQLSRRYVSEPQVSYRDVVKHRNLPIAYEGAAATAASSETEKEREESRALSPSTVWRWIAWAASLGALLRSRSERQQAQADRVNLSRWAIPPWKYRSEERRKTLVQCASALAAILGARYPTGTATMDSGP